MQPMLLCNFIIDMDSQFKLIWTHPVFKKGIELLKSFGHIALIIN